MAEDFDFESRTEAPTQRRRDEAREQGRVAFSAELSTGVVLLAGVAALAVCARGVSAGLLTEIRLDLSSLPREITAGQVQAILGDLFGRGLGIVGLLLLLLFVAGLAIGLAQVGWRLTPSVLALNWERLSPFQAEGRLLSGAKLSRLLLMLVKLAAVALVAYAVLKGQLPAVTHMGDAGLAAWLAAAWGTTLRLALAVGSVFLLLGAADYAYQRWKFERSLRMTRQELKEELRRDEGDPQIKARIRKLQREAAQKTMMQEVPRATVVVTNPTHLAVALRYDRGSMAAPRVVAKGAGHVAKRIAEIARRHAVPVVERKSLARALFKQVKLNQEIPAGLYLVVAELLATVYRLRGMVPPAPPQAV